MLLKFCLAPAFAVIWTTFSIGALLGKATLNGNEATPLGVLFFLAFGLSFAYIFHRCNRGLKNVWLRDECLIVSNGFHTVELPLRSVADVRCRAFHSHRSSYYTIEFDRSREFGRSIEFLVTQRQEHSREMRKLMVAARWNSRKWLAMERQRKKQQNSSVSE